MALSREDKADVKNHLGKALANKVSKVTRDKGTGWGKSMEKWATHPDRLKEHKNAAKSKALRGKLDKESGARDVTKAYKRLHPDSRVHSVHDVMRKS